MTVVLEAPRRRSLLGPMAAEQVGYRPDRGRLLDRVVLAGILAATAALVSLLPAEPWWILADCDASYLAGALNLLGGEKTSYLGHPGLPPQGLLMLSMAADWAVERLGGGPTLAEYVARGLAHPERYNALLRAWAMIFLLVAVTVAYEVGRRLTGRRRWGVVAALLYLAAPEHFAQGRAFRPDNLLSALCLFAGYLLARGHSLGSPVRIVAAAAVIGAAVTVKVHAIGMILPFAVTVWLHRRRDWIGETRRDVVGFLARHRVGCAVGGALWLVVMAVCFRPERIGAMGWKPATAVAACVVYVLACLAVNSAGMRGGRCLIPGGRDGAAETGAWRAVFPPAVAVLGVAFVTGIAVPNGPVLDQSLRLCRSVYEAATGRGVNEAVSVGGIVDGLTRTLQPRLAMLLPFIALAALGAIEAARRRDGSRCLWMAGAVSMLGLAILRASAHPSPHHLGPAIALAIPPALFAGRSMEDKLRGARRTQCPSLAPLLAGLLVAPILADCIIRAHAGAERCRTLDAITKRLEVELAPNEFIMANYGALNEDANAYMMLKEFSALPVRRAFRSLPDTHTAERFARDHGMRPAYYLVAGASPPSLTPLTDGSMTATSVWGGSWTVQWLDRVPTPDGDVSVFRIPQEDDGR